MIEKMSAVPATFTDALRELIESNELLLAAVLLFGDLKHGDCWCDVGIGNPMLQQHSTKCLEVFRFLDRVGTYIGEAPLPKPFSVEWQLGQRETKQ